MMHVYLADDGTYKNTWSHRTLIPTEEQLGWFAMLDAAANEKGFVTLNDGGYYCIRRNDSFIDGTSRVTYTIKGTGNYIGDKEC